MPSSNEASPRAEHEGHDELEALEAARQAAATRGARPEPRPRGDDAEPETPWDHLATLALGEEPAKRSVGGRALRALRQPTVILALAVAALAYPAYRGFSTSEPGPNFPGKNAPAPETAEGVTVVLEPGAEASRAPEVSVHDDRPALEIVLVGPADADPAMEWKVTVLHPGREIWKSKWARRFERVKDEWRLGFELDGRNLPEGPLSVLLEEARPKGAEAGARRETYRLRVKRRG